MGNSHLTDPRKKFHTDKFPEQEQNTPALQNEMKPEPRLRRRNL